VLQASGQGQRLLAARQLIADLAKPLAGINTLSQNNAFGATLQGKQCRPEGDKVYFESRGARYSAANCELSVAPIFGLPCVSR